MAVNYSQQKSLVQSIRHAKCTRYYTAVIPQRPSFLSIRCDRFCSRLPLKMYWNELNPQKRDAVFKFDDSDLKKNKDRILVKVKTTIFNFARLFFSSSNIHGFNHLTDDKRHFTEKYTVYVWRMPIYYWRHYRI